jgi:hypothetical protein
MVWARGQPAARGYMHVSHVDVVGQVRPRALDTQHLRLAAEDALRPDLERDAGDLVREVVQLPDHRVDGVLELEHLAFDLHVDGHGHVARGDRLRDDRDRADLVG